MVLDTKYLIKKSFQRLKGFSLAAFTILFLSWLMFNVAWYGFLDADTSELVLEDVVISVLLLLTAFKTFVAVGATVIRQYRSDKRFLKAISYEGPRKAFTISFLLGLSSLTYFISVYLLGYELLGLLAASILVLTALYHIYKLKSVISENKNWLMPKIDRNKEDFRPLFLRFVVLLVVVSIAFSFVETAVPHKPELILIESLIITMLSAWALSFLIEVLEQTD